MYLFAVPTITPQRSEAVKVLIVLLRNGGGAEAFLRIGPDFFALGSAELFYRFGCCYKITEHIAAVAVYSIYHCFGKNAKVSGDDGRTA